MEYERSESKSWLKSPLRLWITEKCTAHRMQGGMNYENRKHFHSIVGIQHIRRKKYQRRNIENMEWK
jgi:hypothetical protein